MHHLAHAPNPSQKPDRPHARTAWQEMVVRHHALAEGESRGILVGPQGGHDHSASLVGKDENGKWRSVGSDEYTSNLCGRLAHIVIDDEVLEPSTPRPDARGAGHGTTRAAPWRKRSCWRSGSRRTTGTSVASATATTCCAAGARAVGTRRGDRRA